MKLLSIFRRCFFTLCCLYCPPAYGDTFTVIAYQNANPPFHIRMPNSEFGHGGIFVDMFKRLGVLTGDRFVFKHYPVSRALREFDQGMVDIEPGINPGWRSQRKQPGLYSVEFGKSIEVLLFGHGKKVGFKVASDLSGKTLGVVRGYVYPVLTKAFNNGTINRVDNVSEFYLLKQLDANCYDQILIGYQTALYYMKREVKYQRFEIGAPVSEAGVYMRVHPSKAALLPRLNLALEQMLADGEVDAIYAKYR